MEIYLVGLLLARHAMLVQSCHVDKHVVGCPTHHVATLRVMQEEQLLQVSMLQPLQQTSRIRPWLWHIECACCIC